VKAVSVPWNSFSLLTSHRRAVKPPAPGCFRTSDSSHPSNAALPKDRGALLQRMLQHVGQFPAPAMGPSQTADSSVLKGRANRQRIMCNAFLISCTSSGLHLGSKMMALNSLILTRAGIRKAVFTSTIFLNGYPLNKRQLLFLKEK